MTELSPELVEKIAYLVANAKLGEGPAVRCEGPTEFEIDQARQWVRRVTATLNASTLVDEPTEAMKQAGVKALYNIDNEPCSQAEMCGRIYTAMRRTALSHKETNR